jgi:tetratricopeptide (TPR) repeat protein
MSDAAVSHPGVSARREIRSALGDSVVVSGLAFVGVLATAAASGGFFPTSWGWAALAFSWVGALVLLLRSDSDIGWFDLAFFALLAAFVGWNWLSATWSWSAPSSILEGERGLVALTGVGAALVAVSRRTVPHLLGAVAAAIALVSAYGLATRLFPGHVGTFDPVAGYRLEEPLGYWNALGIFAAIGALLSLGFAARGRTLASRGLGGLALGILLPTIYFTFSRGAWLALAIAVVVALVLDPRRLQLALALVVFSPLLALEVWIGSRKDALTTANAALGAATHQGRQYAAAVAAVAIATAVLAVAVGRLERRGPAPRAARLAFTALVAALVVAAVAAATVRYGGPQTIARHAWDSFNAPPANGVKNLNNRLFSLSSNGRIDLWKAAWRDHDQHPVLGSGAGTYDEYWYQHRTNDLQVLDAHNLYAEALAELGPVGLALVALALLVPIAAAILVRGHRFVPFALAAYVAYVVHAGVDWDWEMAALTLSALLVGVALVASARPLAPRPLGALRRTPLAGIAIALAALAFVVLVGNLKLARAHDALSAANYGRAAKEARSAGDWAPWSSDALRTLGDAQRRLGRGSDARATLREAVAKDPQNSDAWYDLYLAASGAEANRALITAVRLNPFGFDESVRRRVDSIGSG